MRTRIAALAVFVLARSVPADFIPIPLTPESYNQDIVVERTASGPVITVTTASMEGGTNNTGFSWYERGYNRDSPSTGLPAAGAIVMSDWPADHEYQFPPSYRSNNVVLLDADVPNGAFVLSAPAAYARVSVLTSSANGSGQVAYTLHHLDGSVETGAFDSPNWFGPAGQAVTAYGRVDVRSFVFSDVHYNNPRLYSCDLPLTNAVSPVTRMDFAHAGGVGHVVIFALSGATTIGDGFSPVAVTGYNQDAVVEAIANPPGRFGNATTATMDAGAANLGYTWYEAGYLPTAPASGLPAPGSILTNACAPDHHYAMAPGYKSNNAVLVDSETTPEAALIPATPGKWSAFSLLCAAGHGPATNTCRVEHADGTFEVHRFVVPDWLAPGPAALEAQGRVNIDTSFPDLPAAGAPKLWGVDLGLTNTASTVTNLVVSFGGGAGPGSLTAILAASGQSTASTPAPRLTMARDDSGHLALTTTSPGMLESAMVLAGTNTTWSEVGPISGTLILTPPTDEPVKFFRVRASPPSMAP